ncbi:MAG: GMC family oxidoreductase N-terminal domain-containing protein [Neomegalonema sp.]|nr:GMC family oxidoreductase N-terminal domain-containing protein [Neomegalonema sp.]
MNTEIEEFGVYDYVIVGAGSAGCVLANRLSADPDVKVLLLEAGGPDDWIWFHVPVGYLYCMGDPRADWAFKTEPEAGLGGRALNYPRGKALGGCSSINGMIYMRGQAADYDGWRQLGLSGWGWDDVLPYFIRSEDHVDGASDLHGGGGELRVERQRLSWEILEAVREAAAAAGVPKTDDFNRGDNFGGGYFQVTQKSGWRWSASTAFLKPVRYRRNLRIETGAQAEQVVIEQGRATGLIARIGGRRVRAKASGEVILAAGAIGSPQLLQLSGVGPGALLQSLGIETLLDRPAVGGNLQDHLQIRCAYRVEGVSTLNTRSASLFGKAMIGLEYAALRSGPMAMAPSQLGLFAYSDPSVASPDLEWHVQPLSLDKFGDPLDAFDAVTMSVCNLRPESRGEVMIASADPTQPPQIRPNYLSTPGDRLTAARGIRFTRKIMAQEPLQQYQPNEFKPGLECETDDELADAAGRIGTTIFHPVGTVRMGTDADAPLDGELRVNGVAGLRVVDGSAMPRITSGNTHAPIVMMAEKASDLIRAARRA